MDYTGDDADGRTVIKGRTFLPDYLERDRLYALVESMELKSNIGIDEDGIPYVAFGANGARLANDTDGIPYFETVG